jgi:hypothetical protein
MYLSSLFSVVLSFPVESAGALVDSFTMLPRVISPTRSANVAIGEDENILLALLREIEATAKMVTRGIRHTTLDSARRRQVRVAVVLELARLGRLQMMRAARAGRMQAVRRHHAASCANARRASQSQPHSRSLIEKPVGRSSRPAGQGGGALALPHLRHRLPVAR